MESFTSNFYIFNNLHRLEVVASPFKSRQKIYVDDQLVVDFEGTLVNRFMFYSIDVENMPLVVSIEDCGLCCDYNVYLDNTSIIDGTRLDSRKIEAERALEEGYAKYVQRKLADVARKTWPFVLLFSIAFFLMNGFNVYAICAALISYPLGLIAAALMGFSRHKSVLNKWFNQYQQWQR